MLNSIITKIHEKIKNIDNTYEYPNDEKFRNLNFMDIDWPSVKDNYFFNILRDLVIRGPLTLTALTNLHVDGSHPYDSVFQTFYRILNGSKNHSDFNLQQRKELIKKNGRSFELTPLGVLYVIHVFHMGKYYDKDHTEYILRNNKKTNDFSYQKNIKGIFDFIKKYYKGYFPLFFDNLDYIKEHKDIDINRFFEILNYNSLIINEDFYSPYKYDIIDFSKNLKEFIPFVFYYSSAIEHMLHKKKIIKFDDVINNKIHETSNTLIKQIEESLDLYKSINSDFF